MKTLHLIALAGLTFAFAVPELAASEKPAAPEKPAAVAESHIDAKADKDERPLTGQQLKMKNCNAEAKAKDLHGDERRAFMSTCLKG